MRLSLPQAVIAIGNRELLAIKVALEEWRHWREEGTELPFNVWMDHKNLPQNAKPDALSCLYATKEPEPILPP
ncbi:hypothetical protein L3Q82_017017 [Scortum barcoo]|uniref:Uncharacterized protein n=1 Tax=Scortum barcoo TaxID=214431 RepID=A0ACB8XCK5_9TELE|nr:hypothetical protein L3Q82_017017 [Scortum barcoo]